MSILQHSNGRSPLHDALVSPNTKRHNKKPLSEVVHEHQVHIPCTSAKCHTIAEKPQPKVDLKKICTMNSNQAKRTNNVERPQHTRDEGTFNGTFSAFSFDGGALDG
uniref:Uncharacterized protein n=1 Tax=Ornithodoros erraticus TaxID=265619 RepID=A0A293LFL5_ORNER